MNKRINKNVIIALYVIVVFAITILLNSYVVASSNKINISGPISVEEGQTLTFNVSFSDDVDNIWLSDGDIIKKGFSGIVKVNKISDRNYTVIVSNVSNVGSGKYIMINSGVGYVNGVPTEATISNLFEIISKKVEDTNNNDSTNNNNNTNNNINNGTSNNTNSNINNNINNNISNNVNNNANININIDNAEDNEQEENKEKIRREIPNTGKI